MIVYGSCVGSVVVQLGVASCGVVQHWFSSGVQLWFRLVRLECQRFRYGSVVEYMVAY